MGAVKWMQDGPFGLMVHYLSHVRPREGREMNAFDDAVQGFDVNGFVDEVESTGAKWLILPFGQNTGKYIAPNTYLNERLPGVSTSRDLFGEIAKRLEERKIRLIAYLPSEVDHSTDSMREAFGWDLDPVDKTVFQHHWMNAIREWSLRYGTLISGWWFDGGYVAKEKSYLRTREWDNSRFDVPAWTAALRAGNPQSIWALNSGVRDDRHQNVFAEEDYLSGEANKLQPLPESALQNGLQWHTLTWLDCFWMLEKPGPIPPPRFQDAELFPFVEMCHKRGGAVTLNIGIYRDGTLAEESVEQLRRLNRAMSSRPTEAAPRG